MSEKINRVSAAYSFYIIVILLGIAEHSKDIISADTVLHYSIIGCFVIYFIVRLFFKFFGFKE